MPINVFDGEATRQAAARYRSLSSLSEPEGPQLLRDELLRSLDNSVCKREREAAKWVRLMVEQHATIHEVAKLRCCSEAAVRSLLKLAKDAIQRIAERGHNYDAESL